MGGSGTRVVAEMLQALGIFLGTDLNEASDSMRLARDFPRMRDRLQALGPLAGPKSSFSSHRNQVRNRGRHNGSDVEGLPPEGAALRFWIASNRHAVADGSRLAVRFFLLNFDDLCRSPERTATNLLSFIGRPVQQLSRITPLVKAPASPDRHRGRDLRFVTAAGRIAMQEFGFAAS